MFFFHIGRTPSTHQSGSTRIHPPARTDVSNVPCKETIDGLLHGVGNLWFPPFFLSFLCVHLATCRFSRKKTRCAATKNHSHHDTPKSPWKFEGLSDSWSPEVVIQIVWQKTLGEIFRVWDFILLEQTQNNAKSVLRFVVPRSIPQYIMCYMSNVMSVCVSFWQVRSVKRFVKQTPLNL